MLSFNQKHQPMLHNLKREIPETKTVSFEGATLKRRKIEQDADTDKRSNNDKLEINQDGFSGKMYTTFVKSALEAMDKNVCVSFGCHPNFCPL